MCVCVLIMEQHSNWPPPSSTWMTHSLSLHSPDDVFGGVITANRVTPAEQHYLGMGPIPIDTF